MDNRRAAEQLEEIGNLIELAEDEPFKARAYHNAARTLSALEEDAERLLDEGKLAELPGFGKALLGKLNEFYKGGRIQYLEELRAQVPPGVIEMSKVSGLGPKKIRLIQNELGITSLGKLREAAHDGSLAKLSGFGAKSVEKIARGIEQVLSYAGQYIQPRAERNAEAVLTVIGEVFPDAPAVATGALRRHLEVVDALHWVVRADGPSERLVEGLQNLPDCQSAEAKDDTIHLRLAGGVPGTIWFTDAEHYGRTVLRTTGPSEYVEVVEGLLKSATGSEEELIEAAGLPVVPPECRDHEPLWRDGIPDDLLTDADLRGVLHCHTTFSDGRATLREMVEGCRERGYTYIGICDHSPSSGYAGGLPGKRLAEQHKEIDQINAEYAGEFRIFKGTESDIKMDGSLDYPDEVLAKLDFVVVSVHNVLYMDEDTATERTCRALENRYTTFLGHSTGRLLLAREGFPLNWDRVIETAARNKVSLELNANPRRLDVDWRLLPRCYDAGLPTAINPDAHAVRGIDDMRYGVAAARKVGTRRGQVLNTLGIEELDAYFKEARKR